MKPEVPVEKPPEKWVTDEATGLRHLRRRRRVKLQAKRRRFG